jgi:hypothetical protein
MAHSDPWKAVLADLTAPAAEDATHTPRHGTVPTPTIRRGHPFTARAESIRCLKERTIAHRRLYAVSFDHQSPSPQHWRWLISVEEDDTGWVARGGAGGAGDSPQKSEPWVNLAGWWGRDRFCAGGDILFGDEVASVRLTTRDGVILEDDTDSDLVLFLTDRTVEVPVTLELLGADGHVVATQLEFDV